MVSEIDSIIGYHCAPAIRGIKVANLVAIPRDMDLHLTTALSAYNEKFNDRGLFFYELCHCDRRRLLLVFRKRMLEEYLRRPEHAAFLKLYGYLPTESLETWFERLKGRLEERMDFPHEIGLFLGYPLHDVRSFIRMKGAGYKLCGEWKVYGNPMSAMHSFHCFRTCRNYCHTQLLNGKQLESLVAVTAC